ncbi:hypothetical protein [Pedobacter metabolipauper]|uniref:Lipoprotein n=1 Tax=Pedobacter metabolipauper TaxID=425513 RepID=A0A4R6SZD9_9SPHI|nr:hypothetical protein [Pedobacter metabolipauper]TDQ11405.1 hypothetical protein ATK78_0526 [Pedobacter metabolipauper]
MRYPLVKRVAGILLLSIIFACNGGKEPARKVEVNTTSTAGAIAKEIVKEANPTDTIHTDVLEFIDVDGNGDNELLIAHRANDTTDYICQTIYEGKFNRGDLISLKWRTGPYVNPGDPETTIQENFVVEYKLVKAGKLSIAKQKGMPRLSPYYYDENISDYGKDRINNEVSYYLINTNNPDLRKVVDRPAREIPFTVEKRTVNGMELYEIWFTTAANKPQPIHNVFYHFNYPYQLFEGDDLKPAL